MKYMSYLVEVDEGVDLKESTLFHILTDYFANHPEYEEVDYSIDEQFITVSVQHEGRLLLMYVGLTNKDEV